jgi:hypothetical protein
MSEIFVWFCAGRFSLQYREIVTWFCLGWLAGTLLGYLCFG